ncbi:mutS protein homolog 4-like [Rhopalosiphum maidis]|uniref:mutS protein homolog 4-like n=1 Tax=Rhopalosiphum maidis TaxID=43146 RepID=UPI000EFF03DA|nr:mutS protein homolog 4-like [Rhopalosiphum maidis]
MNVVNKNIRGTHRKTTENDFQIKRFGQYTVSRSKTLTTSTNHLSTNLNIDNSVVHSRSMSRSDLMIPDRYPGVVDGKSSTETSDIGRITQSDSFDIPKTAADHNVGYVPKYDVSRKLKDFIINCTPRQLIKPNSFEMTPACSVLAVSSEVRNKSHNPSLAKKIDSKSEMTNSVVLVLTEGRGSAQGEIGLAAIDLKRPVLILCQISDTQIYMNTINKINILNPAEILVPNTFMDQIQGTLLYNTIKSNFPLSAILTASRKHFSENEGKLYLKNSIIPECTSTLEQVLPKFYAVSAAAALLKHIEFNHNVMFSSNTLRIEYEGVEKSMFIDANTASRLELVLNNSLNIKNTLFDVLNRCATIGGQRRLRSSILQPSSDIMLIHNRQEAVQEMLSSPEQNFVLLRNVIQKFTDVEQLYWLCTKVSKNTQKLSKLQGNYTLLLKTILEALPALVDILEPFKSEYISSIRKTLSNSGYSKMLEIIDITINKESTRSKGFSQSQFQRCFAIKSNLNPLLDVARTIYSELIEEFHDKVKVLGEQLDMEHLFVQNSCKRGFHVQVELKNIKNFNVKHPPSICKNVECVKNIVKFTTEDLLVLNIRITQALNEVEILTNAILNEMLKELRKYISCIYDLCNGIADLDLIFSFAQYSMRSGSTRPKFGQYMDIKSSRHPILDIINSIVTVDNDIFASTDKNLNIITGPNMGGKSIYIRQVALLQIIAQIGCFVPATFAQFRICDRLFTRIGFGDSIESNASTWVLEIKELNGILPSLTKHSLVIIDELCRATSCEEGSSLAWAICEHIMQSCAFIFFATHSILITKLQDLYCNVLNYHMEALPARNSTTRLTYTYKLCPGVTNFDDYGLTLARDVKMPEHLIENAIEIEKCLRQTRIALPDNPSNEADLILDNCIQKLLNMKDTECLNISNIQLVVLEMMNKLKENKRKNIDPLMEYIDSDNEV